MRKTNVSELIGQTMLRVKSRNNEEIFFTTTEGRHYRLYHEDDCCESVMIEDISGDLNALVGSPILLAEERTNSTDPSLEGSPPDSYTWTFYTLATGKGYVDIRFYGTSKSQSSWGIHLKCLRSLIIGSLKSFLSKQLSHITPVKKRRIGNV